MVNVEEVTSIVSNNHKGLQAVARHTQEKSFKLQQVAFLWMAYLVKNISKLELRLYAKQLCVLIIIVKEIFKITKKHIVNYLFILKYEEINLILEENKRKKKKEKNHLNYFLYSFFFSADLCMLQTATVGMPISF